jgi:PAS domain S-box-containing protein
MQNANPLAPPPEFLLRRATATFEDSEFEREFRAYSLEQNYPLWRWLHFLALVTFDMYSVIYSLLMPEHGPLCLWLGFGVVTPVFLIGISLSFTKSFRPWWQVANFSYVIVTGACALIMVVSLGDQVRFFSLTGFMFCFIFGYALIYLRFVLASIAGAILMIGFFISTFTLHAGSADLLYLGTFYIVGFNGLGMFISYTLDASRRRSYHSLRQVQQINVSLEAEVARRTEAITESNRALRGSEEAHRALVAGLPDVVMRFDRDGRHLFVSDNVSNAVDLRSSQCIGRTHSELGFPESLCKLWGDTLRAAFDSGELIETEYAFESKDGPAIHNWRLVPELDQQGNVQSILTLSRDITAQRRIEREKDELEARLLLQQRLESIGTLASGVAHEINNPINGVINYAQLLLDESAEDSNAYNYSKEIITETERVATIVRNLLAFSRHDKQAYSPACMSDIVEATLSLVRTVFRHNQILLTVDVPGSLPNLKCRSQQIQQVLTNLITNARDALNDRFPGHDDAKTLLVTAAEVKREGQRWIRVTVKDNGTGIPTEIQERIFEPFFTTKGRDQGTGLGLSISHGIVRDHHGEVTVHSTLGEGTKVVVDLPVENG